MGSGNDLHGARPYSLYGLERLAAMPPASPVLLVGNKTAADAAQQYFPEHVCMAWSVDAKVVGDPDFSPLQGRNVILWPDNHEPGHKAARKAMSWLEQAGAYPLLLPLLESLPDNWSLADPPPKGFGPCALFGRAGLPPIQPLAETGNDAIRSWPCLLSSALPGLAGEFVALATRCSEADPAAVLATFLARFGVEVYGFEPGKGPYVRVGETRHPPRLYAVVVGASSRARKGTSAKPVLRAFEEIPEKWKNGPPVAPHTGGPLSSGEGLAFRLRERDAEGGEDEEPSGHTTDKRLFVLDEELAAATATMKRKGNTLSMALRSFWDSGDYEPLTKITPVVVRGAHVGIVTHITVRELRRNLDATQIANGFANRFLWICARRTKLVVCPTAIPEGEFAPFRETLWERIRLAQSRSELQFTPEARSLWEKVYPEVSRDLPGAGGDITARGEAHCIRLALVYALLDGAKCIGPGHLRAALALWQYARDSALYIFGDGEEDGLLRKILQALRSGPKSTTDLNALFGGRVTSRTMQALLQELVGCGLVEKREIKTGGRPRILYHGVEKAEKGKKNDHAWISKKKGLGKLRKKSPANFRVTFSAVLHGRVSEKGRMRAVRNI